MIYLILQLSIITGVIWLTVTFIPGSSQTKRNYIAVGFVICWLALINAVFSSHMINHTIEYRLLSAPLPNSITESILPATEAKKLTAIEQTTTQGLQHSSLKQSTGQVFNWQKVFSILWLLGFLVFSHRWVRQIQKIYLIRSQGQVIKGFDVDMKMYWSSQTEVPFLYAGKSSFIIIPAHMKQWSKTNIQHIIDHELCHYQRKDHWILWIAVITQSVFWFHPLIHVLAKRQKQLIELACDQQLLANGVDPVAYSETLLSCVRNTKTNQPVVAMANKPAQIKIRIQSLLNTSPGLSQSKWSWPLLMVPISMTACVNLGQTDFVAAEQMIELVSYDLQPYDQLGVGQVQVVAFYDGLIEQPTHVSLELKNAENQVSWLKLGPLKKFDEYIHTWQFELKSGVSFTNRYQVNGAQPDGVVDGVALGLLIANSDNEVNGFKSKESTPIGKKPNVVCAWPLGLLDENLIKVLPQITANNPDSVERIICGAQLVSDGTYQLK